MTHHDMGTKMEKISNLKEKIFAEAEKECCDSGDIQKAGELVDMVKDLAEVEEKCAKACYYKVVVEAMTEGDPRYGYNSNRYADGRYAPAGHGNYTSGYFPTDNLMDRFPIYMADDEVMRQGRMGYSGSGSGDGRSNNGGGYSGSNNMGGNTGNSGRSGYNTSQTLDMSIDSIRHNYEETHDPDAKRRMKEQLTRLVNDMR